MAEITMPQLGETVTEGTITRWFKNVGDSVSEDEVLFEVSTDKVDSEVPSPVSGVLTEVKVNEGDTVLVGATIAIVDGDASAPAAASPAQESGETTEVTDAEPRETAAESVPDAPSSPPEETKPSTAPSAGNFDRRGKVLSPVVRKLLAENNLDPSSIQGTGAGGRITRKDVMARLSSGNGSSAPTESQPSAPSTSQAAPPAAATTPSPVPAAAAAPMPPSTAGPQDRTIQFSNMRRRTAEHMVRSKATSAHTLVVIEVDYANVEKVRIPAKKKFKEDEGVSLTYLPFVSRAVVEALREFPIVNSSVGKDSLIVHGEINIGYAVDLNFEGLIVPVIHRADEKRIRGLARDLGDLAARARGKKLSADDIAGGTFTITNPGSYGTLFTGAVINQPQVAILSTDGVKKKPVVVENPDGTDSIGIHPMGNLALAWDHRAFDGAYAAAFLARLREILETRDWSQEL